MNKLVTVGVILDDESKQGIKHTYFSEILESFKLIVEKENMSLLFLNNDRTRAGAKTYYEQLKEYGCVGCIIACANDSIEVPEIISSDIPTVVIDKDYNNAICVSSDNEKGMLLLTEYVIEMGHKRIALIMGDDNDVTNIRLNGFLCACEKNHIVIPGEFILRGKFRSMDKAYYHTENLLKMENPPTCIMYSDDFSCIGGINLINARGKVIAKDISITGYDGNEILNQLEPRLTTIKQDGEKIGQVAAEKLLEKLHNPEINNNGQYVVDVILEKGRSIKRVYE